MVARVALVSLQADGVLRFFRICLLIVLFSSTPPGPGHVHHTSAASVSSSRKTMLPTITRVHNEFFSFLHVLRRPLCTVILLTTCVCLHSVHLRRYSPLSSHTHTDSASRRCLYFSVSSVS